jgi:hypothetical protein
MIQDSDILIKLHKESISFLLKEREDDDEEAVKKYFKSFKELFNLIEKYGTKFPSHIIDRITVQQYIILKKCGVNLNSIQKLLNDSDSPDFSESESVMIEDSDSEKPKIVYPKIINSSENLFSKIILPNLNTIPPLQYINALPIPSPKLPEIPNFKSSSSGPIELEEDD